MKSESTLLPYVVAANNPQSLELVLNIKCLPKLKYLASHRQGNTALLAAISTGNVAAALKLISLGGEQINRKNRSTMWLPLSLAISLGQKEIVQALIARKVRPGEDPEDSRRRRSPLLIAAKDGRHDLVAMLLTMSTLDRRVSDDGLQTALDLAVISGCLLTVKLLLEDPIIENPQELYGCNPTFHAIKSEMWKWSRLLSKEECR
ncbi:ankyrin repeats (3 copies) domain-containing protein [Cordyceps javanica]|nr:ankyrin repeats (3 copies) domain-containing protein [Cordyceps javanica]